MIKRQKSSMKPTPFLFSSQLELQTAHFATRFAELFSFRGKINKSAKCKKKTFIIQTKHCGPRQFNRPIGLRWLAGLVGYSKSTIRQTRPRKCIHSHVLQPCNMVSQFLSKRRPMMNALKSLLGPSSSHFAIGPFEELLKLV